MVNYLNSTPNDIAEKLFQIGAIKVNLSEYYKLGSGDYSPLYVDARALCSDVAARAMIAGRIVMWVHSEFKKVDAVVGVASGGIAWAMSFGNCDMIPVLYARKDAKDHGLLNQIEGELPKDGARVVVIDDVITTGGSALSVVKALREGKNGKKANVLGVFTIFDWDFTSVNKKFEELNIPKTHMVTLDTVVKYGVSHNLLSEEDEKQINTFYQKHCVE